MILQKSFSKITLASVTYVLDKFIKNSLTYYLSLEEKKSNEEDIHSEKYHARCHSGSVM